MHVHCIQTDPTWEQCQENFDKISDQLATQAIATNDLLVFPELATTGFTMHVAENGEVGEGPSVQFFSQIAERYRCYVIAGILGKDLSGRGFNEAVCFGPGGDEIGRYRKMHPFPLCGEGDHYASGTEVVIFEINGWKVSPTICYDLRFPELYREGMKQGAEIFLVIANWPSVRKEHWLALLKARAIENQAYVVGVNRCGADPTLGYPGLSLIADPKGEILAQAGAEPEVISAEVNFYTLNQWRYDLPVLNDVKLI